MGGVSGRPAAPRCGGWCAPELVPSPPSCWRAGGCARWQVLGQGAQVPRPLPGPGEPPLLARPCLPRLSPRLSPATRGGARSPCSALWVPQEGTQAVPSRNCPVLPSRNNRECGTATARPVGITEPPARAASNPGEQVPPFSARVPCAAVPCPTEAPRQEEAAAKRGPAQPAEDPGTRAGKGVLGF